MKVRSSHQSTVRPAVQNPTGAQAEPRKSEETRPADVSDLSNLKTVAVTTKVSAQQQALSNLSANLGANLPPTLAQPVAESFKAGFVDGYLTPKTIREQCQQLAEDFPNLVELVDTGLRTHGYDGSNKEVQGPSELFYLRLGPKDSNRDGKVGVFQYAAPHARERINPMSMMEFTQQLVHNYDPDSSDPKVKANTKLLDQLDVFVAINTNPDGHNFAAYDDDMWRKNRTPLPNGEFGVDINRNYPYQWEQSIDYSSQVYSGENPASEAETQALLQVVEKHPNIQFVVDWHSYGQEIRRPLDVSEKDDGVYDAMHSRVQKVMKEACGNEYEMVVSQVTKGTSDDTFYQEQGMYSTVMETGTEFTPAESEALVVMKESVEGAHEYLRVAADWSEGKLT
jgi:murein tripeptide amidase MpaA